MQQAFRFAEKYEVRLAAVRTVHLLRFASCWRTVGDRSCLGRPSASDRVELLKMFSNYVHSVSIDDQADYENAMRERGTEKGTEERQY